MSDTFKLFNAFISSPGDVNAERQFAEEAIRSINRTCSEILKSRIETKRWEHQVPETPFLPEEKIQDAINKEVEKSHFFVLILNKRYGSIEEGHSKSNTERELETILKRFETHPEIKILAYFRELPENNDKGEQEKGVIELRKKLSTLGIRYKTYRTTEEFKEAFTHDMYSVLLRISLSPFKQTALQRFWQVGESDKPTYPRLAIFFPPVSRAFMDTKHDENFWQYKLLPNVYYEDYKAIHKIKKTLALIGFSDFRTFFNTDLPHDHNFMNRVWVCFPRSQAAMESLKAYSDIARFEFGYRKASDNKLKWTTDNGENIDIKSPFSSYLKEQRTKGEKRDWHSSLNKIYCKDYAVIARFKNRKSSEHTISGLLHDYYFAGIRGLGTWGAAWYIDRSFKKLLDFEPEDDVQLLLEVTYRDGSISSVENVSSKPASYFKEQSRIGTIRKEIEKYHNS